MLMQTSMRWVAKLLPVVPDMLCKLLQACAVRFAERPWAVVRWVGLTGVALQNDLCHAPQLTPCLAHVRQSIVSRPQPSDLTELCLDSAVLTPKGGKLPHLPALRVLSLIGSMYGPSDLDYEQTQLCQMQCPGPQDLGLAYATPLLAEVRFAVGHEGISSPNEQLVTLTPLAQRKTIVLDFWYFHIPSDSGEDPEDLLRPNTLLSLPPNVTKFVLRRFDRCEPPVALPKNIAIVFDEESSLHN